MCVVSSENMLTHLPGWRFQFSNSRFHRISGFPISGQTRQPIHMRPFPNIFPKDSPHCSVCRECWGLRISAATKIFNGNACVTTQFRLILRVFLIFRSFPSFFVENGGYPLESRGSELSESAIRSEKCWKLFELGPKHWKNKNVTSWSRTLAGVIMAT